MSTKRPAQPSVGTRYMAKLSRVPALELGSADVEFTVKYRGTEYGVLAVSRGALVWRPSRNRYEYKIRWSELDEFALAQGEPLLRARHGNRRLAD